MKRLGCFAFLCSVLLGLPVPVIHAQDAATSATATPVSELEQKRQQAIDRGLKFLATEGQAEDGSFTARAGSGITSLAITSALRNGRPVSDPLVAKGLKAIEGFVKPDGGIYGGGRLKNYETCVAMVCLAEANQDGRYTATLERARKFVTELQYGFGDSRPESDPWYGGSSYSGTGRPDLSNTGYMVDALQAMDVGPNDPAIQRALAFISRCQNLESEHNDTAFAGLVKDGGFYYEIPVEKIDPSTSPERFTPEGGLRSYGSMTYAGLKSMIYAGLTENDPRVKAAVDWINANYSVTENPGMGTAGLFYYYHTFGASLNAAKKGLVTDASGKQHDWRADLITALADSQNEDGSWTNENNRWFEDDKNLSTSFALIALSYCKPNVAQPSK
jgi:hypothetical protein